MILRVDDPPGQGNRARVAWVGGDSRALSLTKLPLAPDAFAARSPAESPAGQGIGLMNRLAGHHHR